MSSSSLSHHTSEGVASGVPSPSAADNEPKLPRPAVGVGEVGRSNMLVRLDCGLLGAEEGLSEGVNIGIG